MLLLAGCTLTANTAPPMPTWQPRTVGTSRFGLTEAWRFRTEHSVPFESPQSNLTIADDKVIFPCRTDKNILFFTALSLETGQVLWKTPYGSRPAGAVVTSAALDTTRLYFVDQWTVRALDLATGKIVWASQEFEGHTGYYFRPWESANPLQLHADTRNVILIDPETGMVLARKPERAELLTYGSIEFAGTDYELSAHDLSNNKLLWQHASQQVNPVAQMWLWPSFVGNDTVYLSGQVTYAITRANLQTGDILWQTESSYVSNFALDEARGRLYAMQADGVLATLDLNTGNKLDEVKFSGPLIDPTTKDYSVAVSGSYLLVNFVDTQELIALRLSPGQ